MSYNANSSEFKSKSPLRDFFDSAMSPLSKKNKTTWSKLWTLDRQHHPGEFNDVWRTTWDEIVTIASQTLKE